MEDLLDHPFIEWMEGNITDREDIERAVKGMKDVYHCAAMVSFHPSDRHRLFETNVLGTQLLVNACLETQGLHLIHVSSIAALGRTEDGGEIDESTDWIDSSVNSAYAISKFRAEMEIWRGIEEGLSASIVNPGVILGAGDWHSGSAALIRTIASGFPFYAPGKTGFVDVRDVCDAMEKMMHHRIHAKRYILVSENKTFKEFFTDVALLAGKKPPVWAPPRWVSELGWRLLWLPGKISGNEPVITKEKVVTSYLSYAYKSDRIMKELSFNFRTWKDTLGYCVSAYQDYYERNRKK